MIAMLLILRKVADTLRDSVYAQYTWAICCHEFGTIFFIQGTTYGNYIFTNRAKDNV